MCNMCSISDQLFRLGAFRYGSGTWIRSPYVDKNGLRECCHRLLFPIATWLYLSYTCWLTYHSLYMEVMFLLLLYELVVDVVGMQGVVRYTGAEQQRAFSLFQLFSHGVSFSLFLGRIIIIIMHNKLGNILFPHQQHDVDFSYKNKSWRRTITASIRRMQCLWVQQFRFE